MSYNQFLLSLFMATLLSSTHAFTPFFVTPPNSMFHHHRVIHVTIPPNSMSLGHPAPGYATLASERADRSGRNNEDPQGKVQVNIIQDIDPVTLTAIGFALIAFNFLVFANLGDGGIGSFVARLINTYN
jgi:hypothetical protein